MAIELPKTKCPMLQDKDCAFCGKSWGLVDLSVHQSDKYKLINTIQRAHDEKRQAHFDSLKLEPMALDRHDRARR